MEYGLVLAFFIFKNKFTLLFVIIFGTLSFANRGPIYKISHDSLTIMPKLRSAYDRRLIYKTSYEERAAFLGYSLLAES